MLDKPATGCRCEACIHFLKKPLVVAHQAGHGFLYERFCWTALLGGKVCQFGLQLPLAK